MFDPDFKYEKLRERNAQAKESKGNARPSTPAYNHTRHRQQMDAKAEFNAAQQKKCQDESPTIGEDVVYFDQKEAASHQEEVEINQPLRHRARVSGEDLFAGGSVFRSTPTSIAELNDEDCDAEYIDDSKSFSLS